MQVENVKRVGVLGCGVMGSTIAALMAQKYETVIKIKESRARTTPEIAIQRVSRCFPALVRKGKITEQEVQTSLSRINITTKLEDLQDCDIIIWALTEDPKLHCQLAADLGKICAANTIFMNTTALAIITAQGVASGRPDKVIGTHFCNPAHLMELVEVFPGLGTSQETLNFTMEWLRQLNKVPIKCKEIPFLIVDNLLIPFLMRAVRLLEAGVAGVEEIDTAVKLGLRHPLGPFEILDMAGLDQATSEAQFEGSGRDPAFSPPSLLIRMRDAGYLGKKVGRGFYRYDEQGKKIGPAI